MGQNGGMMVSKNLGDSNKTLVCGFFLAAVTLLLYWGALPNTFIFDDYGNILNNASIRKIWSLYTARPGTTVQGRPLLSFTFALNYALNGYNPWIFRLTNVIIHISSALTLFAIAKRIFEGRALGPKFGDAGIWLGFSIAFLWAVHPLQTQSVTYISQRAESLCGLFYLLALYFFIRGSDENATGRWLAASACCCVLGAITKEVIVTAPLVILLYDSLFASGSISGALKKRRAYYASLLLCWAVTAFMMAGSATRNNTVGFNMGGVSWQRYLATQPWALLHYLKLTFWPSGLILDYRDFLTLEPEVFIPTSLAVLGGLGAGIWLFSKRKPAAFLFVWFFLILAPTSSFVPILPTIEEHRMYLPLAAPIAAFVIFLYLAIKKAVKNKTGQTIKSLLAVSALAAVALSAATVARNNVFASELELWKDNVEKTPYNPTARQNYGVALLGEGRYEEALKELFISLEPRPRDDTFMNIGICYKNLGKRDKERHFYEQGLALNPRNDKIHVLLGNNLSDEGLFDEAAAHYSAALEINPENAQAHMEYAVTLARKGDLAAALGHLEKSVELDPDNANAFYNMGNVLLQSGRAAEAVEKYEKAAELEPQLAKNLANMGQAYYALGKTEEGAKSYQRAIEADPKNAAIHLFFANNLAQNGKRSEAATQLRDALKIDPNYSQAREALARLESGSTR